VKETRAATRCQGGQVKEEMMSNGSHEVERIRQARCILERIRGRLLQPTFQALDSSAADLKLEREVVALRQAVRSVEGLLKNAGKFYAGLARLMAPDEAPTNYTATGTNGASSIAARGSVVLHG
jgi:hypothetical protein